MLFFLKRSQCVSLPVIVASKKCWNQVLLIG